MVCHAIRSWLISRANSKVYVATSHTDKDILYMGLPNKKGTMHYRSREFSLVHGKSDNNFHVILSVQNNWHLGRNNWHLGS